jgi:putative membrane protein
VRGVPIVGLALTLGAPAVLAHEGGAGAETDPWRLLVAVLLAVAALVYAGGARALRRRAGPERHGIARWRLAAGAAGLAVLAFAELSVLDVAADVLFSAHMTQHELVMLVAAPLLVLGRPLWVALWWLPEQARRRAGALVRHPSVRAGWRFATLPVVVFVLHALVLSAWHVPRLFDVALEHDGVHVLQHATFLATAALFWWGLVEGRYGRASYGVAVLYVFATAIHRTLLGALVTFST